MLSISKINTNGGSVHDYYSVDNYYAAGSVEAERNSFWHGKGAEEFGLSGVVDGKIADKMMEGDLPNGVKMQGKKDELDKTKHDPGRDLTFSAPKSVSILTEVIGNDKVKDLHLEAVKETLDYVEKEYAQTRVRTGDEVQLQNTENLTFATYTHNTSRELDPQLHTHCLTMNVTKRDDGKYRAMFFDEIYNDYKFLGLVYRSALANNLQKAGFGIEITDLKNGFFEISGMPKGVIDKFSKRREQILQEIAKHGVGGAKNKEIAALATRDKKIDMASSVLRDNWEKSLKEVFLKIDGNKIGLDDLKNLEGDALDQVLDLH